MPLRLGVLLSGSGSTLENLLEKIQKGVLDAEVAVVVSSKPSAFGLERARRHGLPAHAVDRRAYREAHAFNNAIHRILDEYQPELLVLAGFLSLVELRSYAGRTINTHPALIPAFSGKGWYGDRVHRAVIESGVKLTGVTVHFCDDEYDKGPIILQESLPVEQDDSVESLRRRVQLLERELLPRAIQLYAEDRLVIEKRRVQIR